VAIWDGANDAGARVRPGIYFVRLESRFGGASLKVALLR
jgi:hypothetical protein